MTSASKITYSRVGPRLQRVALTMLLTGRASNTDPAADQFLSFAASHHFCLDELWAACENDQPIAAILIVPNAGRTAMVFLSPMLRPDSKTIAADLVRHACATQQPDKMQLVQALLDPDQTLEASILEAGGFKRLAQLVYMERLVDAPPTPLRLDQGVEAVCWSKTNQPIFERAILESYVDTLDCPALVGLRDIDDIIAGHMATGHFQPELWFALHRQGQPVAVLLLNTVPQRQAIELVYLGISPASRKRGLARKLVHHAIGIAHAQRAMQLVLAVDKDNTPAKRLYDSMRFTANTRKLAMIFMLNQSREG